MRIEVTMLNQEEYMTLCDYLKKAKMPMGISGVDSVKIQAGKAEYQGIKIYATPVVSHPTKEKDIKEIEGLVRLLSF
ncbi:MAG: hypothetical protein NTW17_03610 [Candidatus Pacearchaeota archaeon]|nr:hypothetical protein [Candidatus Pacearchaeota archaeon]